MQHPKSRINNDCCDKQQPRGFLGQWIQISLKCPNVSPGFACRELDYSVGSAQKIHWIVLLENPSNPSQTHFNHILCETSFYDTWVYLHERDAWSRANFVKCESLLPKFCTEARGRVLKPAHTKGGRRSSPNDWFQRLPSISCPAIATPPYSHHESCFIGISVFLTANHKAFGWG